MNFESLRVVVDCATMQNLTPANVPFIGHDSRGHEARVPAGEIWYVMSCEVGSVAGGDAYVWVVPEDMSVAASTVAYLLVPRVAVVTETTQTTESTSGEFPIRIMYEGDAIWIMGGGTDINVYVIASVRKVAVAR